MHMLYVVSNDGQILHFPITKKKTTLGRSKDNDVPLADSTVSRHHAEIIKTDSGYVLSDLSSFNKTMVNGKAVNAVRLKHGDKIELGLAKLYFLVNSKTPYQSSDALVLTSEESEAGNGQQIIGSSTPKGAADSRELLISVGQKQEAKKKTRPEDETTVATAVTLQSEEHLSNLARSNKVLFVLYEISRHLNQIPDMDELLQKIMDLIFMVIDADYGYLILRGGRNGEELIPVVVKQKSGDGKPQKKIKASRTLISKVINDKVALLTSNAMDDARLSRSKSVMLQRIRSAICVPLWRREKIIGVIQLDSLRAENQFTQDDLELLKAIGSQAGMVIEQEALNKKIRDEERLRARLERFHSPQVIDMILQGGQETKDDIMEPKELTATILFTDIIGFTHLAEKMPPREVNILLNRYFSRMTDIIFAHDGTLDKYIGDGLMALFGAPIEKKDDAERAVRAALEIQRQLSTMMRKTSEDRRFDIRIGINTGRVVAGNMGSPKRMEYTVIGDPVNLASRLESIAEPNQILIGEETFNRVRGKFKIREVGPKKVKGKKDEIMVYEVFG